ncbi:MAG: ABC transporter ATP-binding protein [Patescibacteria group bacterium]
MFPAIGNTLNFLVPPLIVAAIIDTFVAQGGIVLSDVKWHIVAFGGVWLTGEVCWRIGMFALARLQERAQYNLGVVSFQRLLDRDFEFFANNFVGTITKKTIAFTRSFELFTETIAFNIMSNAIPLVVAFVILWGYSPLVSIVLVLLLCAGVLIALPLIKHRARMVAERHDAGSKVAGRLSDAMTNAMAIKSFAREQTEQQTFSVFVADFTAKYKKAYDYANIRLFGSLSPVYVATNVCGLILALYFAQKLSLQPGAILVIFTYYTYITSIFWQINQTYRNIESSVSEAAEFTQMLLEPPAVSDERAARSLAVRAATIRFDNVTFRYADVSPRAVPLLKHFRLDIKEHERVGLVGPSGGGKSTLTKLLLRFVDVQEGRILIDGQDIRMTTQKSLRNAISYVPQEPLLFHRSLAENIAYGKERATKKEIRRAARLAHAEEFIEELPKKYDTLVGERGIKLSGGQRQRIVIARAILKDAPILVLDEATSSLDSESEKYIQEGLWELMKNKTAVVIAHRLSTIKHLDRIVVLDRGRIVQEGTHNELIKKKGLYRTLWSLQSGEFLT